MSFIQFPTNVYQTTYLTGVFLCIELEGGMKHFLNPKSIVQVQMWKLRNDVSLKQTKIF